MPQMARHRLSRSSGRGCHGRRRWTSLHPSRISMRAWVIQVSGSTPLRWTRSRPSKSIKEPIAIPSSPAKRTNNQSGNSNTRPTARYPAYVSFEPPNHPIHAEAYSSQNSPPRRCRPLPPRQVRRKLPAFGCRRDPRGRPNPCSFRWPTAVDRQVKFNDVEFPTWVLPGDPRSRLENLSEKSVPDAPKSAIVERTPR